MPYPSSHVSCVPTVARPPTASRITTAPNHAKRPRMVALSSSAYSVAIEKAIVQVRVPDAGEQLEGGPGLAAPRSVYFIAASKSSVYQDTIRLRPNRAASPTPACYPAGQGSSGGQN